VGWIGGTPCLLTGLTKRGRPATWLFLLHTRLAYRRLAGEVARNTGDYVWSGQSIQAVIGVDGSPSCGVRTTLDLKGCWTPLQAVNPPG
jgi:hypothetical protein